MSINLLRPTHRAAVVCIALWGAFGPGTLAGILLAAGAFAGIMK